jgi:type II secretory pathway component PulK
MIYPIQDLLDDRGSALLLTILAVGMLSVLALGLASITMADNTATVQSLGEAKARYAAEAGVNRALYEIRNYLETGISPASSYQDSLEPDLNYNVSLDRIPNTDLFQINAKGTYKNFSGEIKAKADKIGRAHV